MQKTNSITKEVKTLAHKILRAKMKKENVSSIPKGWASESIKEAVKQSK